MLQKISQLILKSYCATQPVGYKITLILNNDFYLHCLMKIIIVNSITGILLHKFHISYKYYIRFVLSGGRVKL